MKFGIHCYHSKISLKAHPPVAHSWPPQRVNVDEHLGVIVTPPDWVSEVLSTSTVSRDLGLK